MDSNFYKKASSRTWRKIGLAVIVLTVVVVGCMSRKDATVKTITLQTRAQQAGALTQQLGGTVAGHAFKRGVDALNHTACIGQHHGRRGLLHGLQQYRGQVLGIGNILMGRVLRTCSFITL